MSFLKGYAKNVLDLSRRQNLYYKDCVRVRDHGYGYPYSTAFEKSFSQTMLSTNAESHQFAKSLLTRLSNDAIAMSKVAWVHQFEGRWANKAQLRLLTYSELYNELKEINFSETSQQIMLRTLGAPFRMTDPFVVSAMDTLRQVGDYIAYSFYPSDDEVAKISRGLGMVVDAAEKVYSTSADTDSFRLALANLLASHLLF